MNTLSHLLEKNRSWADKAKQKDATFFSRNAEHQSPEVLWSGCADSRVPASQVVDMPPGELFVHRNIANMVVHTDLNCLSVMQYAVEALKVKHIVVCGHYGCGGVKAAHEGGAYGLVDHWLRHIKDVKRQHAAELADKPTDEQFDLLCELNVKAQVTNVCNTPIVQAAWQSGAGLTVHGWIYDIKDGMLKDLAVSTSS